MWIPTWGEFLMWLFPMDVFEEIRDDLCTLFEEAYEVHPRVQQEYADMPESDMKEYANRQAATARNYKPSNPVTKTKSIVSGLNSFFTMVFVVLAIVGSVLGYKFVSSAARMGLELLQSAESILISAVLGSSGVLGLLALVFLLWLKVLELNPTVVQTFNEGLVIGHRRIVRTNDKSELVSIIVWNTSLIGSGGIKLVNIFSIFWILSVIPGWNPYNFLLKTLKTHMDAFVGVDSYSEAGRVLWGRMTSDD